MSDLKNNILISIIIPTFNRSNTIERTINSVLNQTYQNFEIIIIDDFSSDYVITQKIIESINDSRINLYKIERKVYGAEARNIGVNYAKGEIIAFLDSDDEWLPNKLEIFYSYMAKEFGYKIYYSSAFVQSNFRKLNIYPAKSIGNKRYLDYIINHKGAIYTPTIMLRKECAEKIKWNKILLRCQDYAYCTDFQRSGGTFVFINEPLTIVNWRRPSNSKNDLNTWKFCYKFWYLYKDNNYEWKRYLMYNVIVPLLIIRKFGMTYKIIKKYKLLSCLILNLFGISLRILKHLIKKIISIF